MPYQKLFERGRIGKVELRNRIVMPAMGCSLAADNGEATESMIRYYQERAKGGCGLIISEICRIDDETGVGTPCQLSVTNLRVIPSLVRLAEAVHAYDTKIFIQLHHPGNQTPSNLLDGKQQVSASDVTCATIGEQPRALTTEEVEGMVKKFVKGAWICQTAGIDGVEIHAAHGYLLDQFLSPHTNKRTDKYGGDLMGRMMIVIEIVKGIQAICGPNFPISVRINGSEYLPDGLTKEDGIQIAKVLESLGVACLNVSCGTYETGYTIIEPNSFAEGWKKDLARDIKASVSIPVIAVNTVKHPSFAEQLLEENVCDFVGVARGHLADPEWGNKAHAGEDRLIRKCIGCLECFRVLNLCRPVECTINPILGREYMWGEDKIVKNGNGAKVAVIGGGPAGMQAAIVLKKRGYKPVILEKSDRLGGTANIAAIPPHKELMAEFIDTLVAELDELGVEVKLNTPGSVEACKAIGAEGVFLATGGYPIIPGLPGAEKALTAENVLLESQQAGGPIIKGKNIAVIGGGVTGLETADYLSEENHVAVIEMLDAVGTLLSTGASAVLLKHLAEKGTEILTGQVLTEIKDGSVVLKDRKSEEITEKQVDTVILAMGVRSDRSLEAELRQNFHRVIMIGDTDQPGQIRNALHAAYDKAFVY